MKTLTKHIEEKLYHQQVDEKLIINKDFDSYNVCTPNKNGGYFLQLYINTKINTNNCKIYIEVKEYTFKGNRFRDDNSCLYKRNKKGYYYSDTMLSGYWMFLALIGSDAIEFLNILSNDVRHKFNLFEYFDKSQQKLLYDEPRQVYINGIFYVTDDDITKMINKLNEKVN